MAGRNYIMVGTWSRNQRGGERRASDQRIRWGHGGLGEISSSRGRGRWQNH